MKKTLTIQDLSCFGQCSLTVALPILSAAGIETAVLPTAVLSTHTSGFTGFTFRDLSEDLPAIFNHWEKEKIQFDAIYIGYLGNASEIQAILNVRDSILKPGGLFIVDPAMADNGRYYPGFDDSYGEAMRELCKKADVLLPNRTEACFLTELPYKEVHTEEETDAILRALFNLNGKKVVLTGITGAETEIGVATYEEGVIHRYLHYRYKEGSHGTGDIYSSVFTAAFLKGDSLFEAAEKAADFTLKCIEYTKKTPDHTYGASFEPFLKDLADL